MENSVLQAAGRCLFWPHILKMLTILLIGVLQVDHFSFANQDTYSQRYLINTTYWKRGGGPIFFYTGNEGDIGWF